MTADFQPRDVLLRDGRAVRIRAFTAADEAEILQAFDRLGAEARYKRFMRPVREANLDSLHRGFETLARSGLGIAATVPADDGIDFVGTAIYIVAPDGQSCEFAMTVVDAWAGAGLGRVLLETLVEAAAANGERVMEGFVLAENAAMLRLAARLGFEVTRHPDDFGLRVCRRSLQAPPQGG